MSEAEFQENVRRLDALVQEFESLPYPQIRERVFALLQAVDVVHRQALSRLVALLRDEAPAELFARATGDPVIRLLLLVYELIPDAPELAAAATSSTFIPLEQVGLPTRREPSRPAFKELASVEAVPPGTLHMVAVDGVHVLLANVEGTIYATRDQCPGSMAPLHLGRFTPPIIVCPWHNEPFDIRTGKRVDGAQGQALQLLPVSIIDGTILVGVSPASAVPGPERL